MEADFSGWATKVGLKCSDGRTIMAGAFRQQDKARVPLVWQHGHGNPENVLGHAILEDRPEGVWTNGYFNDSPAAKHAKGLLQHGDINMLSIWANELMERGKNVLHGKIREVSLVLSGANPGAIIENVTARHGDGMEELIDDEAVIYTGLEFEHADKSGDKTDNSDNSDADSKDDDDTVADVYESMSDQQKDVLHYMVSQAMEKGSKSVSSDDKSSAEHSSTDANKDKEGNNMTRNVFDKDKGDEGTATRTVISHDDMKSIVADAEKSGSMKSAIEAYALAHGITEIDTLFPEAKNLTAAPEFFGRRTEWVSGVLTGAKKTPFARIRTHYADLNFDEARAKGYVKGAFKKEEFFGVAGRTTTPKTIYKKQKLDRDDIIDITDFDVVAWMKGEMRLMLDEEIARAILIGDGRAVDDEDKINEDNIRPIATDHDLYAVKVYVNLDDASSSAQEIIDALITHRQYYRGAGQPTMFTTETMIARFMMLKDTLGRRIYRSLDELATELRVDKIVPVEVFESEPTIVAVLVNMGDYVIGANKGGEVNLFDDFDIDYNQYKYLIETRISGALAKLKSAIVVRSVDGDDVLVAAPNVPTFVPATGVVTIVATTGVVYKNALTGATLSTGAQSALAEGASLTVQATPATGYYLTSSENEEWKFTRPVTP